MAGRAGPPGGKPRAAWSGRGMGRVGAVMVGGAALGARRAGAGAAALVRAGGTAKAVGACPARALENLPGAAAAFALKDR
ncbi:hypothetical protein [Mesorhizobium loti]|uniref:hypothetical protein n=1 Tax=Rhizobium loti TaxID=381 RepID=UPI001378C0B9|nr:hypothetical protein [Mesorhizobium loti]